MRVPSEGSVIAAQRASIRAPQAVDKAPTLTFAATDEAGAVPDGIDEAPAIPLTAGFCDTRTGLVPRINRP